MSIPDKIYWFLGYNDLALILEQEKKHWLLKTDKKKVIKELKESNIEFEEVKWNNDAIIIKNVLPPPYQTPFLKKQNLH